MALLSKKQLFSRPFLLAVSLHFLLFLFIFSSFFSHRNPAVLSSSQSIIQASVIDPNQLHVKPQPPTQSSVTKEIEALQVKAEQEQKLIEEQQQKQEQQAEEQELQNERDKQAKLAAEKASWVAKQKAMLAAKRKAEQIAKQKQLLAEKQKKQALAKKIQQMVAADLQKQLAAEGQQLRSAQAAQAVATREVDRYKALIVQAISQRWNVPSNMRKDLFCKLFIHLAPGGMVLDVKLLTSSGDMALDRSAITAVYKASPLPVPQEVNVFNYFRELNLIVRPEMS